MVYTPDSGKRESAEAARDFIMAELVTKTDLNEALERWSLRLSVRLGIMLAAASRRSPRSSSSPRIFSFQQRTAHFALPVRCAEHEIPLQPSPGRDYFVTSERRQ